MIDIERIAHVCHEANRALQVTGGEEPSPHFFDAPEWQVQSAYEGVSAAIEGATPEQLHESWCAAKVRDGWIYGDVKDAEARTHPCLVAYDQLPADQRLKDHVFQAVVHAFTDHEQVSRDDRDRRGGVPRDAVEAAVHAYIIPRMHTNEALGGVRANMTAALEAAMPWLQATKNGGDQ